MENYKVEREDAIRNILLYVCEHRLLPENAHDWDVSEIIKECVDSGYLENVKTVRTKDGQVRLTSTRPFVTGAGLSFLYPGGNKYTGDSPLPVEIALSNEERDRLDVEAESASRWDKWRLIFEILGGVISGIIGFILGKLL